MTMFVFHFVDPDLGVEKEGKHNKRTLILKSGVETPTAY